MERKFGYYIVLGLVIGGIFRMGVGAANGNTIFGIGLGGLGFVAPDDETQEETNHGL